MIVLTALWRRMLWHMRLAYYTTKPELNFNTNCFIKANRPQRWRIRSVASVWCSDGLQVWPCQLACRILSEVPVRRCVCVCNRCVSGSQDMPNSIERVSSWSHPEFSHVDNTNVATRSSVCRVTFPADGVLERVRVCSWSQKRRSRCQHAPHASHSESAFPPPTRARVFCAVWSLKRLKLLKHLKLLLR